MYFKKKIMPQASFLISALLFSIAPMSAAHAQQSAARPAVFKSEDGMIRLRKIQAPNCDQAAINWCLAICNSNLQQKRASCPSTDRGCMENAEKYGVACVSSCYRCR